MSDTSGGFMASGPGDRLSAFRAPAAAPPTPVRSSSRRMRIDLLLGVLLVLGGIAVALYVRGGANVTPVSSVPGVAAADSVPQAPDSTSLLAGEVAVSFAVDDGNYPPSLGIGDEVRIIVTPSLDGAGEVRPLGEKTVVVSIDAPADAGAKRVITVRGPESIAAAIAGSGPIHVAILGGAAS